MDAVVIDSIYSCSTVYIPATADKVYVASVYSTGFALNLWHRLDAKPCSLFMRAFAWRQVPTHQEVPVYIELGG